MHDELLLNVKFNQLLENAVFQTFVKSFKDEKYNLDILLSSLRTFIKRHSIQSGLIKGRDLGKLVHRKVYSNHELISVFINQT